LTKISSKTILYNKKTEKISSNKVTTIRKRITKLTKKQMPIPVLSFNDATNTKSIYKRSKISDDNLCTLNEDK